MNTFTPEQIEALPANNKYRKYYEWKRDPEKRKLPDGSVPNRGRQRKVALSPFGLDYDADNRVIVSLSDRTFTKVPDLGGTPLFNLLTIIPDTAQPFTGFIPAKAILSQRLAESLSVPATRNRITGRSYKTNAGKSYTVPFGRVSGTSTEFAVQRAILLSEENEYIITFTPERLRRI